MNNRNRKIYPTTYSKFLLLIFTVLFLMSGTSLPAYASEMSQPLSSGDASSETYTIIGIENNEAFTNLPTLEIVRTSTQNTEPLYYYIFNNNLFRATVTLIVRDSSGNETSLTGTITWDCTDNKTLVDTTVCGDYVETGTIKLPDGSYIWGEGVSSVITFPVRVYDPEPVEIIKIMEVVNEFDTAWALKQNEDIATLLNSVARQTDWPCYDADGNEYLCPVIYNTENVRNDEVGVYYITATFEEPLNCRFSDNLTVPSFSIPVSVQAPGQPRINLSYISSNYEFIIFPWITSGINLDTVEVQMSENDGKWKILELEWEAFITDDMLSLNRNPYASVFTVGNSYKIQVTYEGGQTGIASFTYGDGELSDKGYVEGDRDGGDTDGNPPENPENDENTNNNPPTDSGNNGNTSNNPPEVSTDNGNNSLTNTTASTPEKKEPVTIEGNTPKENTFIPADDSEPETEMPEPVANDREAPYLLGSEIDHMIQNTGTARFSEDAIMLNIPEDAIASLAINETDRLLVTILPLENNGFSIDILKNDIAITNVSGMQVSLPYQPPANTLPVLMNEADIKIADGDYNPDTGLVTFSINETGIFYIQDEEVPMQDSFAANTLTVTEISTPEENTDNSAFKLIALVAIMFITCSVGITIFVYTKKRRR